jgi:hypothetical protein
VTKSLCCAKTLRRGAVRAVAISPGGTLSGCAWFPGSTDLCITGQRGLYAFTLLPPAD